MPVGPGKYDSLATYCMHVSDAETVIVIVLGGNKGQGFSVQSTNERQIQLLPDILRNVADELEQDIQKE